MATANNTKRDIIVIGGSAGSIEALRALVARLPSDLRATVFVVVHIPHEFPSYLTDILSSAGRLPATSPVARQKVKQGVIYVAPPDRHLLIEDGHVEASRGPRENRHRPAIDPLFRTAARTFGSRVIGVILSGHLDDGSSGLMAVKMRGGLAVVQAASEALYPEMPTRAKEYAGADYELPVAQIADLLVQASTHRTPGKGFAGEKMRQEIGKEADKAKLENDAGQDKIGEPSEFACPECHGVLWEVEEGGLLRFRCRVGHAYTAEALQGALSDSVEAALWASMRTLEEKAALLRRLGDRSGEKMKRRYDDDAKGYEKHAETIRKMLIENQQLDVKEKKNAASG